MNQETTRVIREFESLYDRQEAEIGLLRKQLSETAATARGAQSGELSKVAFEVRRISAIKGPRTLAVDWNGVWSLTSPIEEDCVGNMLGRETTPETLIADLAAIRAEPADPEAETRDDVWDEIEATPTSNWTSSNLRAWAARLDKAKE